MPVITIKFRGNAGQAYQMVTRVLSVILGKIPDYMDIRKNTYNRVANKLLYLVWIDFQVKSSRGRGIDGDSWQELSPVTIKKRNLKYKKKNGRRFRFNPNPPILIDTGALLRSLTPAKTPTRKSNRKHQILNHGNGWVEIGTDTGRKTDNHTGKPPKLPQRRFWPDDIPDLWMQRIIQELIEGIMDGFRKFGAASGGRR